MSLSDEDPGANCAIPVVGRDARSNVFSGVIQKLSLGGAKVLADAAFAVGTVSDLSFRLDAQTHVSGRVVSSEAGAGANLASMRISFVDLKPEVRKRLEAFLAAAATTNATPLAKGTGSTPKSDFARENTRHPVAMPVSVRVETWDQYAVLYTGNISRGGLFIRMADPPMIGTALHVRLGLPDGRHVELEAEVAHVVSPEQAAINGRKPGIGIRFVGWTAEQQAMLAGLVAKVRAGQVAAPGAPRPDALEVRPPSASTTPSAPADPSLVEALRGHLADLKEQDLFAVLGLSGKADHGPGEVRAAFLELAKRWHPSRFALKPAEVRTQVAEIFIVIRKAHDTLLDPVKAATYRMRIAKGAEAAAAAARPPAPSPAPRTTVRPNVVVAPRPVTEKDLFGGFEAASPGRHALYETAPIAAEHTARHRLADARDAYHAGDLVHAVELTEAALASDPQLEEAVTLLREIKEQQRKKRRGIFSKLFGAP